MTSPPQRAFRFAHSDWDPEESPGFALTPTGAVAMIQGDASIRQALLLLLSTHPGERVMRPTYGCDLRRIVFAPNDDTTAGLAIHYVRQAIERWEPRVRILRLDAGRDAEGPERLWMRLDYEVRDTRIADQITWAVPLQGETS
jgi:phage baseplate assembly protein W